jgi:small subunit ribosomal protein S21
MRAAFINPERGFVFFPGYESSFMKIMVRDNNVEQALRVLKKRMQREGIFRQLKQAEFFEKPSEKRVREQAEAIRRSKKMERKKLQREGLLPMPKGKPKRPVRTNPFQSLSTSMPKASEAQGK